MSLINARIELNTVGHSKVPEQLGHDKVKGSQPPYLQCNSRQEFSTIFSTQEKFLYRIKLYQSQYRGRIKAIVGMTVQKNLGRARRGEEIAKQFKKDMELRDRR